MVDVKADVMRANGLTLFLDLKFAMVPRVGERFEYEIGRTAVVLSVTHEDTWTEIPSVSIWAQDANR